MVLCVFCISSTKAEHREPSIAGVACQVAEWDNGDFISAGNALVHPVHHVKDPVGFLCHNSTLLTHMELLVHQDPQIPFHRAASQTGPSQPVLHSWIVLCQCKILPLSLLNFLKFSVHPINVLLVLSVYFSAFPSLVHFSSGFEQIQRFTVKLGLCPDLKGDELG